MALSYFPGQKPDEKVVVLVRPHWLVMLRSILVAIVLAIIPPATLAVLSASGTAPFTGNGRGITAVVVGAYYLMLVTWLFIAWLDFYLDVGIVTNQRVVDIDQRGLFRRNIAELDCQMVQDVSADKSGMLQTFFDFGDVTIQTAGERPNFEFNAVPHPGQVVTRIQETVRGTSSGSGSVGSGPAAEPRPPEPPHPSVETPGRPAEPPKAPAAPPSPAASPPPAPPPSPQTPPPAGNDELPREFER